MVKVRVLADSDRSFLKKIELDDSQSMFANSATEFMDGESDAWELFVIELDERVVGYFKIDTEYAAKMDFCPTQGVGLRDFVVDPKEQGKGVGRRAIAALIQYLDKYYVDYSEIYLTVNCKNIGAVRCYLRAGFVQCEEQYLGGPAGPQYIMKASIN